MVKIEVGDKIWFYNVFDDGEEYVRLYDDNGEFVREFRNVEAVEEYVKNGGKKREKKSAFRSGNQPEMQETLMKRLEQLQGGRKRYEFAKFLGINPAVLNNYLIGARFPTPAALVNIAEKCGVTVDWLIREKPSIDFSGFTEEELRYTLESIVGLLSKYEKGDVADDGE